VVIKRSSASEVAALLEDLAAPDAGSREAAVARLAVIGTRAVEGLLAVARAAGTAAARSGAFAALEAIGDPRAADAAVLGLDDPDEGVRGGAAALARRLLDSARGAEVLDRLTAIAVDAARGDRARLAALEALRQVPDPVLGLLSARLKDDPSPAVRASVLGTGGSRVLPPLEALERAAEGGLPDDPDTMRHWLGAAGARAALPTLHRIIQRVRERERDTTDRVRREAWMTARAIAHQVLAERGSTVALYDLRETIEGGEPAAVEMLTALKAIGDQSCLEPIAAAVNRLLAEPGTLTPGQPARTPAAWWCEHLAAAFRAIAAREKLTERQAVTRRIRSRWPSAAVVLLGPVARQ
jgi:hypothetical protein